MPRIGFDYCATSDAVSGVDNTNNDGGGEY